MFSEQTNVRRQITHLMNVFMNSEFKIRPHCFLTGPSGSGKTFMVSQIAKQLDMNFLEINAAQLTREGVSGNSLSKALVPLKDSAEQPTIVFVDEFDKLLVSGSGQAEEYRQGVQDELLKVIESNEVLIYGDFSKYHKIPSNNTMFVFAGAFHGKKINSADDLTALGLRPEFIGRVPLHFSVEKVSLESLLEAVPHSGLLNTYLELFPQYDKDIAVKAIRTRLNLEHKKSVIGIRQISLLVHQHFMGV